MGKSTSPLQLAGKFAACAKELQKASNTTVDLTAKTVKKSIVEISPSRLRGVGKKGANIGVRYRIDNFPDARKALVWATGPWQFIEGDTKAGIRPRKRRTGRGKNRFIGPIQGYFHPGTKGKHLFRKGAVAGLAIAGGLQRTHAAAALKKVF